MCWGRWRKEAGLKPRKRSPAARRLPGERWERGAGHCLVGARRRLRLRDPLGAQLWWAKLPPRGDGTAGDGHNVQVGHRGPGLCPTARPSAQQCRHRRERGWDGRALAAKTLGRDRGEPRNARAGGHCPSPPAVNTLPAPAAEMPKIFHPPRPRAPGHSGVAGGVAAVGFQVGCTSPVPRSSSPPAPQEGSASPAPLPLLPSHGEAPGSWEPWTGLGKVQEWLGAGAAAGPGGEVGTHLPPGEGLRAWPSPRAVGGGPGRPRGHRDAHGADEPQPPPHHGHRLTSPSCEAPRSRPALLEATTTRAPQAEAPAPRPPQAGGLAGHAALLALITASVSGSFPSRLAWRKRCEVAAAAGKHLQGCRGQDAGCSGRSRSPQEQPAPLRERRHPSTGSGRVSGKSPAPEVNEAGIWRGRR